MVSTITFSTAIVQNSITNPLADTSIAGDNTAPYTFLEFITNTRVEYTPEEYNKFYIFYLKEWSEIKSKNSEEAFNYVTLYVEFLKEITLTYTTQQELKFLSTLNFNDPLDLDIAIPFYTEKIRQLCLFVKEKREEGKYVVDRNKIKGSEYSIQQSLFEKIYDFLFTAEEDPQYTTLNYTLSNIYNNLKIDIREFVDVYSNYFDIPRVDSGDREFYSSNVNDIDIELFFDSPSEIFASPVFLSEIPIAVNIAVNIDVVCSSLNPIVAGPDGGQNINQDLELGCFEQCGFSFEEKIALKKRLIQKYIGVDFYYIDNTVIPPVSGILFKAEAPYGNIQNLQTPDTATTPSNQVKLLKDIGLFFKPDKTGIFKLNANNYSYNIDFTKLNKDKVYIYPDPAVYGNVGFNKQTDYPLIFEIDYRKDVKNVSSTFAVGDPYVKDDEQNISPIYTKQQSRNKNFISEDSLNLNFADLYNKGYITKYQTDIYGNEYALFKDEFGSYFKQIELIPNSFIKNLLLNGYLFFDPLEGYNFDYSQAGVYSNTIRSGLSTHTVDFESSPSFNLSGRPLYLYFREYYPYQELDTSNNLGELLGTGYSAFTSLTALLESFTPSQNINEVVASEKECGTFTFYDGTFLPDPIHADYEDYPSPFNYYYTTLVEAGLSSLYPLHRAYLFPNLLTEELSALTTEDYQNLSLEATPNANFTLDVKSVLSASGGYYDCRYFSDNIVIREDLETLESKIADDSTTLVSSLTGANDVKSQIEKRNLEGKLYVKNQTYSLSYPISTALSVIFNKYNSSVKSEVYEKIKDFEIVYDSIIIETPNYLLFDKIKYDDNEFKTPSTKNTFYSISGSNLKTFSSRFFNEKSKDVTFCVMNYLESLSSTNYKTIYPEIYRYDVVTNNTKKLYPTTDVSSLSSIFSLSAIYDNLYNVNIIKINKPSLTFNSYNQMYKLTYTGVDNNNLFHMFDYEFDVVNDVVTFYSGKVYKHNKSITTTSFGEVSSIFININPISGAYTINNITGELVL